MSTRLPLELVAVQLISKSSINEGMMSQLLTSVIQVSSKKTEFTE